MGEVGSEQVGESQCFSQKSCLWVNSTSPSQPQGAILADSVWDPVQIFLSSEGGGFRLQVDGMCARCSGAYTPRTAGQRWTFIVICECLLSIVQFKKTVYASLMDWCMQGLSAAFSFVRELCAHQPRNDSGFTFLKYKRMALYP